MTDSTIGLRNDVVLHASDGPEDVDRATAAGAAIIRADPALRVRVIVNGPALDRLISTAERVAPVDGVTVQACQVGMRRRGIEDGLQPGIQTVASAVVSIVQAQREGASYVRI